MNARRGQAVVIDALFFLMVCGFASAIMLWGSSVYGNQSIKAFQYMYLNEYQNSALALVSQAKFNFNVPPSSSESWVDRFGLLASRVSWDHRDDNYLTQSPSSGQYTEIPAWAELRDRWENNFCSQSPVPLILKITLHLSSSVSHDYVFACPPFSPVGTGSGPRIKTISDLNNLMSSQGYFSTDVELKECYNYVCTAQIISFS